jgi:DNA-binding response OmpR family regulator
MDVVAKPFDPDFLLAVVENCLLGRARRDDHRGAGDLT